MKIKHIRTKLFLIAGLVFFSVSSQAQEAIPTAGGEATGSGGTVSYTVGQVNYQTASGTNGSISEGVQQPFEISVTSTNDISGVSLNVKAYPNPTQGEVWLYHLLIYFSPKLVV